jgi:hypothetical protein
MQFEVFKNGGAQPVAFLVMFPGATSGKFNQSSGGNTDAISFATGDTLTIVGPIGHAGPLAGISITLCGLITG